MSNVRFSLALISGLFLVAGHAAAGPLNPPVGPVTSTYKTLAEVEPRIAINEVNTPGDANSVYRITQPGSYYLTGNIVGAAGKYGIEIEAGDVTIDLGGHAVIGTAGSLSGVAIGLSGLNNLRVLNGTVRGWGNNGIDFVGAGSGFEVRGVHASHNNGVGLRLTVASVVVGCTASNNAGGGIKVGVGSTAESCTARSNGGTGIDAGAGSTISACTVKLSTGSGVVAGNGCIVRDTAVSDNGGMGISVQSGSTVSGCSVYANGIIGIQATSGCVIRGNTCTANTLDGIQVSDRCLVADNVCSANGRDAGVGAGIRVTWTGNRIEGNSCTFADTGIDVDASGNFIVRNSCSQNATNWAVVAGNKCLVVMGANCGNILGDSGGVAPGSTDPNANFTY